MADLTPLVGLAIQELPGIVGLIKELHAKQQPDAPPVTDAEVVAALNAAVESSVNKDDAWIAAHP